MADVAVIDAKLNRIEHDYAVVASSVTTAINLDLGGIIEAVVGAVNSVKESIGRKIEDAFGTITQITNGIFSRIGTLEENISRAIGGITSTISQQISSITDDVSGIVGEVVKKVVQQFKLVIQQISDTANSIVTAVTQSVKDAVDGIAEFARTVAGAVDDAISELKQSLETLISDITTAIKETLKSSIDELRRVLGDTVDALKRSLKGAIDAVATAIGKVQEGIKTAFNDLLDYISESARSLDKYIRETLQDIYSRAKAYAETVYERIRNWIDRLLSVIYEIYADVEEKARQYIEEVKRWWYEDVQKRLIELQDEMQAFIDKSITIATNIILGRYDSLDAALSDVFGDVNARNPFLMFAATIFISAAALPVVSALGIEASQNIVNLIRDEIRASIPDERVLTTAYYLGAIDEGYLRDRMHKRGYDDAAIDTYLATYRRLLEPGYIIELVQRMLLSPDDARRALMAQGFSRDDADRLLRLVEYIPPVADVIRFAVREAFTPEIAERFGQYEDFPEEILQYTRLNGMSDDVARMYWAAHWDLPSATQGFEMLHRGIIDEDDLRLLLRALDVMPYWRDKLIQLSYRPLTRVDVRRMYRLGVLDEDGVYKAYRDLGYNEENAKRMTEFTIRYETKETEDELSDIRNLTRSVLENAYIRGILTYDELISRLEDLGYVREDAELLAELAEARRLSSLKPSTADVLSKELHDLILRAYQRGAISREEAVDNLRNLGYDEDEAEAEISVIDYRIYSDLLDEQIDRIGQMYMENTVTAVEATTMLNQLNLSSTHIERLLERWDSLKQLRTRKPSEAMFAAMLRRGIITVEEYKEELRGLGYNDKYIDKIARLRLGV